VVKTLDISVLKLELNSMTGNTTNGIIERHWDLMDEHGRRFKGSGFGSVFHIPLTDSGRTQTLKGP
jgi:uncharacterized protein affecting Mg2+/Co2+ transport